MKHHLVNKATLLPRTVKKLSINFKPQPYTVIIGKGSLPAQAIGNRRLRVLVESNLEGYSKAKYKREKTTIVSNILFAIQGASPTGGFVKFDGKSWWEVADSTAREKIASTFRDYLHSQYRSSTKFKVAKRRRLKAIAKSSDTKRIRHHALSPCLSNLQVEELEKVEEGEIPSLCLSNSTAGNPICFQCTPAASIFSREMDTMQKKKTLLHFSSDDLLVPVESSDPTIIVSSTAEKKRASDDISSSSLWESILNDWRNDEFENIALDDLQSHVTLSII
jgi:hypothetical protein